MKYSVPIKNSEIEIRKLHNAIHDSFKRKDRSDYERNIWKDACVQFHSKYSALCFLNGFANIKDRLMSGIHDDMEYAVDFVEIRPYFFRSGYMYQYLLRHLKNAPLPESLKIRYERVLAEYKAYRLNRLQK